MKKVLLSVFFFFLASNFIFSQAQNNDKEKPESKLYTLSVEDAVALALENNITIKQGKMDLDLLKSKKNSSWNSISPSLTLTGGLSGGKSGFVESFDSARDSLSWSASAGLRMNLSPSLGTSIKAAKLAYEQGEMTYEQTQRKIELSVRKTFYQLLYFNENLELQEMSLQNAFETFKANLSKYNQGRLSELNLLTSQYNYESRIPTVENLKRTYESNLDSFKETLGLKLTDKVELTGSLEDSINFDLSEERTRFDLEEVPAIKTALKNIEIAENSLTATRFSYWGPSLTLSASASTGAGLNPKSDQTLNLSYGATVNIPLDGYLPWSNGALSIKSQKQNLEKLEQSLEQTKTSTLISIRNSINAINQALAQLELYKKNVELMQKTYDMTRNAYNVGSADLLSLQSAEVNLYQAKYNVENQRYTIISAVLDLENTLGLDFGTLNK
ncbi:MAG: TolC family protein [Treponema sp.]|nr:TolC family protein [Treponema sp.]